MLCSGLCNGYPFHCESIIVQMFTIINSKYIYYAKLWAYHDQGGADVHVFGKTSRFAGEQ